MLHLDVGHYHWCDSARHMCVILPEYVSNAGQFSWSGHRTQRFCRSISCAIAHASVRRKFHGFGQASVEKGWLIRCTSLALQAKLLASHTFCIHVLALEVTELLSIASQMSAADAAQFLRCADERVSSSRYYGHTCLALGTLEAAVRLLDVRYAGVLLVLRESSIVCFTALACTLQL